MNIPFGVYWSCLVGIFSDHRTLKKIVTGAWQLQTPLRAQAVHQIWTLGWARQCRGQTWTPWPGQTWTQWGAAWVRWGWEGWGRWGGSADPQNSEGLAVGKSFPPTCRCIFWPFYQFQFFSNNFSMLDFTLFWNSSYGKCILLIKKFNIKPNIIFPCKNVFVLSTFCQTLGCDFMM